MTFLDPGASLAFVGKPFSGRLLKKGFGML
jgi:hypothetical protein